MSDETKAIEETAKAAQALAKTSSKAIDATRDVGGWLDRMFGRAIEHTVGRLWTDRAMASRVEAAIYDWARLTPGLGFLGQPERTVAGAGLPRRPWNIRDPTFKRWKMG
jgi:hypothetical protein